MTQDDEQLHLLSVFHYVLAGICSSQNIELEPWLVLQEPEIMPRYRSVITT